jgi:hypothetical protein
MSNVLFFSFSHMEEPAETTQKAFLSPSCISLSTVAVTMYCCPRELVIYDFLSAVDDVRTPRAFSQEC